MIKRILRIVMMILKRTIAFAVIVGISTYVLNYLVNHVFYVENEENLRRILHIMNVLFWFLFLTCKDEEEFGEIFAVVVISMPFYLPYMFTIFEKKYDPNAYIYANAFMLFIVLIARISYNFAEKILTFMIVGVTLGFVLCFVGAIAFMSIMDIGRGGSTSPTEQIEDDADPGTHRVNGYYRKDGTHVDSYIRSNPDGDPTNNLKP
ncbi:TPA: DUF3892 domain-containing protein [Bacillus cereus]|uniref:DUF3892 domain-containing protein n=1 Tax=Bacillus TaxID=1386 RepID=UPI0001A114A3|nr:MULTISPECIES: DUF3892 domain-containing protein [Bacillus cereus group]EEL84688.1 hypothetical protein bcere0029_55690 [Bacillus cereus AH1272]EEL90697.1 hypothetical protein bcere0030_53640 [Bacillus cereus AH1273]HDX9501216.1 DUF3892 domain-containing protein [Bacillus thuringiensis]KXI45981.1 hypothetical protein ACS95_27010 [Bacillus cereus]MDA1623331.1 DUF3892 domain-containing protein [Bacillus cereus group sp. TH206-1LC]